MVVTRISASDVTLRSLGLHVSASIWCRKKRYASLKIVGRLAKTLDVEPAELLRLPPKRKSRPK
jgi:hypothetical protein